MPTTAFTSTDSQAMPALLVRAVGAFEARRRAEVELLDAAQAWASAHTVECESAAASLTDPEDLGASLFRERFVPLAGAGTPLVAEFAPVELSGALGVPHETALALIGDALDLVHRLPRLWALVRAFGVPAAMARHAAQASRDLSPEAVDHADRLLVWQPRRLNPHRVKVLVHEARLYADPDRARADHDRAMAARRVEVRHEWGAPDTSEVSMTLDTADAAAFDATVGNLAETMRLLGHLGDVDVRRAASVGILADPQRALDLLAAKDVPAEDWDTSAVVPVADEALHRPVSPCGRGPVTLVLHLSDRDLMTAGALGAGAVASHDVLGPVAIARLAGWLSGASKVTVKPVLDPDAMVPVDAHDPPKRMAEYVRLRDPLCVFPGCTRRSATADLDHITPYLAIDEGGPPGQTHPDGLAPLCRRHHRAKTHGEFRYRRQRDGAYRWRLPTGIEITTPPPRPRPTPRSRPGRSPTRI